MQLVYGKVRVAFSKDAKLVAFTECKSNFSLAALDLVDPDYWYAIPATNAPDLHSGADGCYVEPRNEIVILGAQYRERGQQLNVYVCSLFKGEWQRTEVAGSAPLRRHSYSVCCEESQIFAIGGYEVEVGGWVVKLDIRILTKIANRFQWSSPSIEATSPDTGGSLGL